MEKDFFGGAQIETIYFGGGTPSLLSVEECSLLLEEIYKNFPVSSSPEITLEANPDDMDISTIRGWKSAGINRLSIGVQSFFEVELKWMNRAHNARQARQCIEWSLAEGLNNLSIDLIYGSPLLEDEMWHQNVETAFQFGIPHLSCYALTVEEKTPLFKTIEKKLTPAVENEKQARQFMQLMKWSREAGFEHYEVSNFAKPGMRSRHNSSYWKGSPYLGLGPSAHSFDGMQRRWNISNNNSYIRSINENTIRRESEVLSRKDRINEMLMISLRTKEGLDLEQLEKNFGADERERVERDMKKFIDKGLLLKENNCASLTDEGMLAADGIAAELFI